MSKLLKQTAVVVALMVLVALVTVPETGHAVGVASTVAAQSGGQTAWACLACAFGAGIVVAGGLAGIAAFLATPGAEALVVACGVACGLA